MKRLLPLSLITGLFLALPAQAAPPVVKAGDDFFSPKKVTIKKGGRVVWKFVGENAHNVALWAPGRSLSREPTKRSDVKTSGRFTYTFRKAGTWRVVCEIHPSDMRGKVVVTR